MMPAVRCTTVAMDPAAALRRTLQTPRPPPQGRNRGARRPWDHMPRRRLFVCSLVALLVAAAPATASAVPSLKLDRACYAQGARIAFTATGFPRGARLDVVAVSGPRLTSTGVRVGRHGVARGHLPAPLHALQPGQGHAPLIVAAHVLTFDTVPAVPVTVAAASRTVELAAPAACSAP